MKKWMYIVKILMMITVFLMGSMPTKGQCSSGFMDTVEKGDIVQVQKFLEAGTDVNQRDEREKSPLLLAVENGDKVLVQVLLAWKGDVNAGDVWNKTPLLAAAQRMDNELLYVLLGAKANPDIANRNGVNPLIASVQKENVEGISALLEHGADINAQDGLGRTALRWAVQRKNAVIVKLLLENNANIGIEDKTHMTAQMVAEQLDPESEIALLFNNRSPESKLHVISQLPSLVNEYTGAKKFFHPAIEEGRLMIGNPKAPVTIVEYTDLQCPYCAGGAQLMKVVLDQYKDKVRVIVKNNPRPVHQQAIVAALYFEAVIRQDPDEALQFLDLIFQRQEELKSGSSFLKKCSTNRGS